MALKPGEQVRLIQPIIEGSIIDATVDKQTFEVLYLVRFIDGAGEENERYFKASDLEVITKPGQ
jgi:hypothetical protein